MIKGYIKIISILKHQTIDIVHVHMAEKGSVFRKGLVLWFAKRAGCKTVIQMHAGPIVDWYNEQKQFTQRIVKRIFNAADKFLVLGEYWKGQLISLIPEEKVEVLYNGIECLPKNIYNPNGKYITFMGLLKKTKGCFDLVDAVGLIDDKISSEVKFVLCGHDVDKVEQYVNKKNLKDRFIFTGWIEKDTLKSILDNTMLTVLPSYFEALSMTVLESMSRGIPVITTDISTMREVLGADVKLFPPGDVKKLAILLEDMISNEEKRINESNVIYSRSVELFSMDSIIQRLNMIYGEMYDEHS